MALKTLYSCCPAQRTQKTQDIRAPLCQNSIAKNMALFGCGVRILYFPWFSRQRTGMLARAPSAECVCVWGGGFNEVSLVNPPFFRSLPFCKVTSSQIPARIRVSPPQTLIHTLFQKSACPTATTDQLVQNPLGWTSVTQQFLGCKMLSQ